MKPILRPITKLWIKSSVVRLLFSSLIALSLSGCAGLKKFPTRDLYLNDEQGFCVLYKLVDEENFKYEEVGEIPCRSVFGFKDEDIPKVMDWLEDAKAYGKKHCK